MDKDMQKENEYLKKRIKYLELLVDAFNETSMNAIKTNNMLLDYLKEHYPKKSSTLL